jgi:hypothetical protein
MHCAQRQIAFAVPLAGDVRGPDLMIALLFVPNAHGLPDLSL